MFQREWAESELDGKKQTKKKLQKGFTRADLGIIEIKFAAIGGSWELSQVIEVSSSPKFLSCKRWLTPWCQSSSTSVKAKNETLEMPLSFSLYNSSPRKLEATRRQETLS